MTGAVTSPERLNDLLSIEVSMRRVRWVGAAFAVAQFTLYVPPPGVDVPFALVPAGLLVAGLLAAVNLLSYVATRAGDAAVVWRAGLAQLAADTTIIVAVVWLFSFDEESALWALLVLPVLEGARRVALSGALWTWAAVAAGYLARDLWAVEAFDRPFAVESVTYRMGIVLIVALTAGFLSRDLERRVGKQREATRESAHRATLLASVAEASRTMTQLDPQRVLETVVGAAERIGFAGAEICFYDAAAGTWTSRQSTGMPDGYAGRPYPIESGIAGRVYEAKRTIVVDDYASWEHAIEEVAASGYRSVVAVPVWSAGSVEAVLVCGQRERTEFSEQVIEALELLAAQAGRVLEHTRRFEEEHQARERLAELDALKRDFLSTVSHELRTPLTVISGMAATLSSRWDTLTEDTRRDLISRVASNADALAELMSRLLDLSHLESGRLGAQLQLVRLDHLVAAVATRLESMFGDHVLEVESAEELYVRADPVLIERVLENLLSNGCKHTPAGTAVRLSAHPGPDAGTVVVAVHDTGPGIPEQDVEHIRDRFYRGGDPDRRATRGIGIGLSLADAILELHGSRLEVETERGVGSRFWFVLPTAAA